MNNIIQFGGSLLESVNIHTEMKPGCVLVSTHFGIYFISYAAAHYWSINW